MRNVLKTTTALKPMSQTATKLVDDGKQLNAEVERRKTADTVGVAVLKSEVVMLVNSIEAEVKVLDTANGRARAMAIVTLCLMLRHKLMLAPTKANLSKTSGNKDFTSYLSGAFKAIGLDWADMIAKSDSVETTWREALAGYVWLWKTKCLNLTMSEEANGNYAHLGLLQDEKTKRFELALDINIMAAAGVKISGKEVKPDGGIRRASAKEVIEYGQALLQTAEYWKAAATTTLDLIEKFDVYCLAIAAGKKKPDDGPLFDSKVLDRLKVAAIHLSSAIDMGEKMIAQDKTNAANMKAEMDKRSEPKVVHIAPKKTAKRKAA